MSAGDAIFEDVYDLTPVQLGVLAGVRREPMARRLVCQAVYQLAALDEPNLWRAWAEVIGRHAVLRTSIHWEGLAKPVQVVHPPLEPVPRAEDWSALPPVEQKARLKALLASDTSKPIDVTQPPAMRWTLARLGPAVHVLLWSYHPLALDRDSARVVFAEVQAAYTPLLWKRDPGLPPAGRFRDYATSMRERGREPAVSFWHSTLRGFTVPTPLPDAPAGPADEDTGRNPQLRLGQRLTAKLRQAAKQHQVKLLTLVQAAWALLLGSRHGSGDVVFGLALPGPTGTGVRLVGPLHGVRPVRVSVLPEEALGPWLARLYVRQEESQEFAYLPPEEIQACAEVPATTPLFNCLVAPELGAAASPTRPGELEVLSVRYSPVFADCRYLLTASSEPMGLRLRLTAMPGMPAPPGQLLKRLQAILARLASAAPEWPLARLVPIPPRRTVPLTCLRSCFPIPGSERSSRPALFLIPPAGGSALNYASLAHHLGSEQPVYVFEPRGQTRGQRPQSTVPDMANYYLEVLRTVQPRGSYHLGGWSVGGLVAYEMARQLTAEGQEVAILALFDTPVAVGGDFEKSIRPRVVLRQLARQMGIDLRGRSYVRLSPGEFQELILTEGRAAALLPPEFGEADLRRHVLLYRAHLRAAHAFRPPPYPGRVTLFLAEEGRDSAEFNWNQLAGTVDITTVPGRHDTILHNPNVRILAAQLGELLCR